MKIPILGGSHKLRSVNFGTQRSVNLYPVLDKDGKSQVGLFGTPGLIRFAELAGEVRGLHVMDGTLYAVAGNMLYSVDSAGNATSLGSISSATGPVSMADNGTEIAIADGTLNIYTSGAITTTAFAATRVQFLDGYFLFNEPDSGRFRYTGLYAGVTIDSLDVATAEGAPDDVVSLIVDHREIWLFGSNSTEVWYNSGGADVPFARIQGALIETGCAAAHSVAKADNSVFWVSSDDRGNGHVMRANGYVPQIVSDRGIELILASGDISDARGYTYQQEGHTFYVLTLPTLDRTVVYDASTGLWHERMWWDGAEHRHRGQCYAFAYGKHLVGDHTNGRVYQLSLDTYADDGDELVALRESQHLSADGKRMVFASLQVDLEAGVGLVSGQGSDPQIMLQWSDDGGHTWGSEHWRSMGKIGEYRRRALWHRLGSAYTRTWRIKVSDPVKRVLIDGFVL